MFVISENAVSADAVIFFASQVSWNEIYDLI